jgi:predicted nucleotidyltransferase
MSDYRTAIRTLSAARVDFIIIGGIAATLHGAARATYDVDVVYARNPDNLQRLVDAFAGKHPYLRGAPEGLPFRWDAETLARGLNFTLKTDVGDVDVLGEVTGGGTYEDLLPHSQPVDIDAHTCRVITLPKLIAVKKAAGRSKDLEAIAELEALLEERDGMT